ncbi:uncharacterized protein DUF4846 [Chitinophaga skermanii]|uniref:Uncharacterized protein DUF4846 n=1 Tax=Chitinophaga skermanii TaxID=331697 RepID=A0A327QWT8_9BACT|nr:DUF4846 domain-containing protein [Chitinophaga skermanii]RAJ08174.1 uncharacterized protein DUF4846 [Chitinophaga skermanii]
MVKFSWLLMVISIFMQVNVTAQQRTQVVKVEAPTGFTDVPVDRRSFAGWLYRYTLIIDKKEGSYGKLDITLGKKDVKHHAAAPIFLRAYYLYNAQRYEDIHFYAVDGTMMDYVGWRKGDRYTVLPQNKIAKERTKEASGSMESFRVYTNNVITFSDAQSLRASMNHVTVDDIQVGDVFIKKGDRLSAAIVMRVVKNKKGEKMVMLAENYKPSVDIQILMNNTSKTPWHKVTNVQKISTMDGSFDTSQLFRFE